MIDNEFLKKYGKIVGMDEAGRGPLFGPVITAAVVVEDKNALSILEKVGRDSKRLSPKSRENRYHFIVENFEYYVSAASAREIDIYNILVATNLAFNRIIKEMGKHKNLKEYFFLVDGKNIELEGVRYQNIIKGDNLLRVIGAASIIAKVYRDNLMEEYAKEYPQYNLNKNKGYPTPDHIEAILKYGVTPEHRITYKPIKNFIRSGKISLDVKKFEPERLKKIGFFNWRI